MKHLIALNLLVFPLLACSPQPQVNAADLETEIKLARAEGFAVTIEDLRKKMPSVSKEDNAADLVFEMIELKGDYSAVEKAKISLDEGDESAMAHVENALLKNQALIPLIQEIATKKAISFDRKWDIGVALTFPEIRTLKMGHQILLLMAWKSANQGDHTNAIVQINQAMDFAKLINEPLLFPGVAQSAMKILVFKTTAMLANKHPNQNVYTNSLKQMIAQNKILSTADFVKNELALVLATYDAFKTKESSELYNKSTGSPFNSKLAPNEPEYSMRKAEIIKLFRETVQVYNLPKSDIPAALSKIDSQLLQVLKSNPNAQNLVDSLGPIPSSWKPFATDEQIKIVYGQVAKILESKTPAPSETNMQLKNGVQVKILTEVDGSSFRVSLIETSSQEPLLRAVIQ